VTNGFEKNEIKPDYKFFLMINDLNSITTQYSFLQSSNMYVNKKTRSVNKNGSFKITLQRCNPRDLLQQWWQLIQAPGAVYKKCFCHRTVCELHPWLLIAKTTGRLKLWHNN